MFLIFSRVCVRAFFVLGDGGFGSIYLLGVSPDSITLSITVEVFRQTDTDYLNQERGQQKDAGSTASTAVLVGDRLLVANVGDSRVVACRAGAGLFFPNSRKEDWKMSMQWFIEVHLSKMLQQQSGCLGQ